MLYDKSFISNLKITNLSTVFSFYLHILLQKLLRVLLTQIGLVFVLKPLCVNRTFRSLNFGSTKLDIK